MFRHLFLLISLVGVLVGNAAQTRPNILYCLADDWSWPHAGVSRVLDLYPQAKEVLWVQEEPKNMGAWSYVAPRLRGSVGNVLTIRYVGRPERASPAEGYPQTHEREQSRIVEEAVSSPQRVPGQRRASGVMGAV